MQSVQVLVIGGGASGMMAAITAAQAGGRVLLVEKLDRLGKKLLATGNGKCNYTNSYQDILCYRGEEPEFAWEALKDFSHQDVIQRFREMGILPRERAGYCYPASGQATSVQEALIRQLKENKVRIQCGEKVISVEPASPSPGGYLVTTTKGKYLAQKVILALGGKATPIHGTSGDGYGIAKGLGMEVIAPLPALTSCILKGDFTKHWTGVRVQGKIVLYDGQDQLLAQDEGELQMVDYGISGIPVFQVSRYAAKALQRGDKVYLQMDILPEYSQEELGEELLRRQGSFPEWSGVDALDGMMHRKLAKVLLHSVGMESDQKIGQWKETQRQKLAQRMKGWKLGIEAVSGFEKAQVTCGGVATRQIDCHTMESKSYPGLYLTGELLDIDGICGGYNLQWAWTSGWLAGRAAAGQSV